MPSFEAKEDVAVFLGAGTSKACGFPITSEILPKIISRINTSSIFRTGSKKHNDLYTSFLKSLLISLSPGIENIFSKSIPGDSELPLVTDLLSQLDHSIANGLDLKDWNFEMDFFELNSQSVINERWDLKTLKILFEWAITNVIADVSDIGGLKNFVSWIGKHNKRKTKGRADRFISILTTNYDFSLEYNLLDWGQHKNAYKLIDYGFSWRETHDSDEVYQRPSNPKYRILKLHGSVDWLKCERCGYIYINPCSNIYPLSFVNYKEPANMCHCGYWPLRPVLVTPSYIRNSFDTNLHEIWKNALECLRKAKHWYIIGYSLPNEDVNIKSLFLRAYHGRKTKPNIVVIQDGDKSKDRYVSFFGTNNLKYFNSKVESFHFD